jgi:1-acyl-sn-glycerol-3-phosphate acyltransferase
MTDSRAMDTHSPANPGRALCEYATLYSSLLLFVLLCLSWSLLTVPLSVLLPRERARRTGRRGIMATFRIYTRWLEACGAYRLDLRALEGLPRTGPLILAPNHPSLIDALLILSRQPNLSCVMKADLLSNILLAPGARLARYIHNGSPRQMVREAVRELRRGGMVLLFPEGTRSTRAPLDACKKSVGVIARRANTAVQTLLIETDSPFLSKGCALWTRPALPITYRVRLGRRFEAPEDPEAFRLELEHYFRSELAHATPRSGSSSCR